LSAFGRRFHPEVADVHPELLALFAAGAAAGPEAEPPPADRLARGLRAVFRTSQPVLALPLSAPTAREMALRAVVEHRALVVVAGPAGEELARTAEALGKEVIRAFVHPGQMLEPDQLRRFLLGPPVDAVVLAHAEPGTGAMAPLAELAQVVRAGRQAFLMVDASGSLGAAPLETEGWGLDLVLAPSEGALGLPPGLAFATMSPRLVQDARRLSGRGVQLDLVSHLDATRAGLPLAQVPAAMLHALDRQLGRIVEEESLEGRWGRHAAMRELVEAWAAAQGDITLMAAAGRRSPALSCLVLPGRTVAPEVVARLGEEGWRVGAGRGGDSDRSLRIGHMGDLTLEHLRGLLEALTAVLATPP
jgi:aspartate aminotransferase-like enzyme